MRDNVHGMGSLLLRIVMELTPTPSAVNPKPATPKGNPTVLQSLHLQPELPRQPSTPQTLSRPVCWKAGISWRLQKGCINPAGETESDKPFQHRLKPIVRPLQPVKTFTFLGNRENLRWLIRS